MDASPSDLRSFGGDSESGDTNEAEIYVDHCEPRCVKRMFVASSLHKLGRGVRETDRRWYALDEHRVATGRDGLALTLHPDVRAGRVVRNLPAGWSWYEVEL